MPDSTRASGDRPAPGRWQPIDVFFPAEATEFALTTRITRNARRAYMSAHFVSEETADEQIRQLGERILSTGRLALERGGKLLRTRSHKADGSGAYSSLLDLVTRHVIGYQGPAICWFDDVHVPTEDLLKVIAERRRQEKAERQTAHEQRMRGQQ